MKKIYPLYSSIVHPSEYDYFGQFSCMVTLANKHKETYCEMDVGKVWGLVLAYKESQEKLTALQDLHDSYEM